MTREDAIIRPIKTRNSPDLPPPAVMAATRADLRQLTRALELKQTDARRLYMSWLYPGNGVSGSFSVAGPMIGAPYAVMVLETLIAWGGRYIVFVGWCGSISRQVRIGDIILPAAARIEEGTSGLYTPGGDRQSYPSFPLLTRMQSTLGALDIDVHQGVVWSTDAVYRETPTKVRRFQRDGVLAVEMELSALFTVGRYRGAEVVGLLVVSDELTPLKWKPGFKSDAFNKGRKSAIRAVVHLCQSL